MQCHKKPPFIPLIWLRITVCALLFTYYCLRITVYALLFAHYCLRITVYALLFAHYLQQAVFQLTELALRSAPANPPVSLPLPILLLPVCPDNPSKLLISYMITHGKAVR
jgi:hypothetical protein